MEHLMSSLANVRVRKTVPVVNANAARARLRICLSCPERSGSRCGLDQVPIDVHAIVGARCKRGYLESRRDLTALHVFVPQSRWRRGRMKFTRKIAKVANGIAGIYVAVRKLCPSPAAVVAERRSKCDGCKHRRILPPPLRSPVCSACDCLIEFKTQIGSEQCPKEYWPAVKVDGCRNQRSLPIIGQFISRNGGCAKCNG
jgi:hypothetical protein